MSSHSIPSLGVVACALLAMGNLSQVSADPRATDEAGGTKHLHAAINIPTAAASRLLPTENNKVHGQLWLSQTSTGVQIKGQVQGLAPGLHGFHIHEFGDLSDPQGKSAGGHFNPLGKEHGAPDEEHRHVGDLGNIKAGEDGMATVNVNVPGLKLDAVIGRSFVVHADADDLKSQPSGASGDRVAVGVIGIAQDKEQSQKKEQTHKH